MKTASTVVEDDDDGPVSAGLRLLIMSLDSFGTFPLPEQGELVIGRASHCALHIEDLMASRQHAVLRVSPAGITLEDSGSANGTRVRGEPVAPGVPVALQPGDAVAIGSTVLVVQHTSTAIGPRRLWSHSYFETRVDDECRQAGQRLNRFALLRARLSESIPWTRVLPILAEYVQAPNLFATYGPRDYEVLALDAGDETIVRLVADLRRAFDDIDQTLTIGVAHFPRDGRTADALIARANQLLRPAEPPQVTLPVRPPIQSAPLAHVYAMATRMAAGSISVLVLGETGVGKEVLAQTIHAKSPRAANPIVAVNCAGLTESLIESELFGHEKGAFTGAVMAKPGLIESADKGTLFLDEIGEMPLSVQAKLLRVIETQQVTRLGSVKPRKVDVRFISATNRNLEVETATGGFRADLYFRLNGMTLSIPPLRERVEEIEGLARHFLDLAAQREGLPRPELGAEVLELVRRYDWPGNVRELKNVMERALLLCDGSELLPAHLPVDKMKPGQGSGHALPRGTTAPDAESTSDNQASDSAAATPLGVAQLRSLRPEEERQLIIEILRRNAGNQSRAAKAMGISRRTLITKIERHGIPRPQKDSALTPDTRDDDSDSTQDD